MRRSKGRYRSGFEKTTADYLRSKKVEFEYEQESLDYLVYGRNATVCPNCGPVRAQIVRKYTPDFHLINQDIFLETKGRFLAKDRSKMIAVKRQHPRLDVRLVFMKDNFLASGGRSKQRYSDWATRNGFLWCIKHPPDTWLVKRDRRKKPVDFRQALGEDLS